MTDDLSASVWQATLESADYWPMANTILQTLGGKPKQLTAPGVSCGRHPPLEECISHLAEGLLFGRFGQCVVDRSLGNSVGANGWLSGLVRAMLAGFLLVEVCFGTLLLSETTLPRPGVGVSLAGWSLWAAVSRQRQDSYLVDSASSHMLVSKIKPCMSKYKQLYCETANGSLNQLSFI